MFERFTEKARRVIFWGRYAAVLEDSEFIETHHLLEGIGRERPDLFEKLHLHAGKAGLPSLSENRFQKELAGRSASREISLSEPAKRSLTLAAEGAEKLKSDVVGVAHVLWGIFQADPALFQKLENPSLTETNLEALCRQDRDMAFYRVRQHVSGLGYDLHRLAEGRKLIVGGVELPFEKGPVGHSDGDVLAHAICDALLGAAGLGDIGTRFPDTDPQWQGVSSLLFLEQVRKLLKERSLRIAHIDAIVITEKPKLGPHFLAMREALARSLGIQPEQINLKAKTNEGVDAIGRGEAIAAQAIATLEG